MDDSGDHIRLYLVRVWRKAHVFHAAVRPPGAALPRLFTEPGQLAAYLADEPHGEHEIEGGGDGQDA